MFYVAMEMLRFMLQWKFRVLCCSRNVAFNVAVGML